MNWFTSLNPVEAKKVQTFQLIEVTLKCCAGWDWGLYVPLWFVFWLLLQTSKLRIGYLNHVEQEGVLISIKQVNLKVPYRIYVSTFFTLEIDIIRSVIDKLPIRAQPVWSKNDFQCIRCSPHWLNHLWSLNCINYWTKNCANGLGTVKSLKIAYYQPLWSNYFL